MSHTKEPWFYGSFGRLLIVGNHDGKVDKHYPIADLGEQHFPSDTEEYANARRIVACVNACAGLETQYLEQYGLPGYAQTISDLRAEVEKWKAIAESNVNLTDIQKSRLDRAERLHEAERDIDIDDGA